MTTEVVRPETWWNATEIKRQPYTCVREQIDYFKQHQSSRYEEMRRYVTVMEYGFRAGWSNAGARHILVQENRMAPNHAQKVVKSITTEVAAAELLIMFSPKRGSIIRDQLADDASTLAEGLLDGLDYQEHRSRMPTDFAQCSIGIIRTGHAGDDIFCERMLPEDVYFDPTELRYGRPRTVFIENWVDRWTVMERYGATDASLYKGAERRRDAIAKAPAGAPKGESTDGRMGDRIRLVEAYHLPNGKGATKEDSKGGRYAAVLDTGTLVYAPWTRDYLPLFPYVPVPSHQGVHGIPTMRNLAAMQREHEKVSARIQRGQQRMNGNRLVLYNGAELNEEQSGNDFGEVWNVTGPVGSAQELVLTPIHPQAYEYRDGLKREMSEVEQASLSVSEGQMPQGIRDVTGVAMAEMKKSHTQARVEWFSAMEKLTEKVVYSLFDDLKEMVDEGRDLSSVKDLLDVAEYEDLDIKDIVTKVRKPKIKAYAIPGLSQDPSQRHIQLAAMAETGNIPRDLVLRMTRWPTMRPEMDLQVADVDMIDAAVMRIVTTGRYEGPEAHDKLALWIDRTAQWIDHFRAQTKTRIRISAERMHSLRQLRDEAAAIQAGMNKIVPAGAGGQSVMPTAPGGTPPTSPEGAPMPMNGAGAPQPGMGPPQ